MADEAPAWRQMFDMLATPMGEKAASLTNSAEFSAMLMNFTQNWQKLNDKSKEAMSQMMHASNVPAYTDITKLSRQVGKLTGKVETLLAQMELVNDKLDAIQEAVSTRTKKP